MAGLESVVLSLSCADQIGIVHAVTGYLGDRRLNIVESQQFGDPDTGRFFLRIEAERRGPALTIDGLREDFGPLARRFGMTWELHDSARRPVLLLMVSKLGHCLNDLLYRHQTGALAVEIPAIVSNHPDMKEVANMYGIGFHHLPVTRETKHEQEEVVLQMVDDLGVDVVVLARYMQILTPFMVDRLPSRIINIHHGLLPGFEGAAPHQQAFDHGVKVIGATAHYVTSELDEGPIIEQTTSRVDSARDRLRVAEPRARAAFLVNTARRAGRRGGATPRAGGRQARRGRPRRDGRGATRTRPRAAKHPGGRNHPSCRLLLGRVGQRVAGDRGNQRRRVTRRSDAANRGEPRGAGISIAALPVPCGRATGRLVDTWPSVVGGPAGRPDRRARGDTRSARPAGRAATLLPIRPRVDRRSSRATASSLRGRPRRAPGAPLRPPNPVP